MRIRPKQHVAFVAKFLILLTQGRLLWVLAGFAMQKCPLGIAKAVLVRAVIFESCKTQVVKLGHPLCDQIKAAAAGSPCQTRAVQP